MPMVKRDVVVVGGGLAGRCAALGFAAAGFDTALVASEAPRDRRSTAVMGRALDLLEGLGLGDVVASRGEALATMRIIDDTGRLIRAPTAEFRASEIDRPAFGYNILNADLAEALDDRIEEHASRLTVIPSAATDLRVTDEHVEVETADGSVVRASLAVGADGRNSLVRERSGIASRSWTYPQKAIVLNFGHDRSHDNISNEFHTRTGPFTQVPLPGRRSSLVWVEEPDVADLVADLPSDRIARMVEDRMHSILGAVEIEEGLQTFPLSGSTATRLTSRRVALIAEAAHVSPPIGAQGLNLGLRDAEAVIEAAKGHRDDPGSRSMLAAFEASRALDVLSRSAAVDLLNRSLLSEFLPVQALRSLGLGTLNRWSGLRRWTMREGVAPGTGFGAATSRRRS